MNTIKFAKKLAIPLFVALAYVPSQALAQSILGADLDSYAVFGKTLVSSDPISTITRGDVGSLTAITGTYNLLAGSSLKLPAASTPAGSDLGPIGSPGGSYAGTSTANGALAAMANTGGSGLTNLGTTFGAGVYDFGAGSLLGTQTITLDGSAALSTNGTSGSNALWVFRFTSGITTITGSNLSLINVGDGANVGIYWSTATTAYLNADTWAGNVLSLTDITSDGGLKMGCGRLLAGTAVTLIGDSISTGCAGFNSAGFDQVASVPEPETYAMLLAGLGLMGFVARRRQRNLAAAA